MAERGHRVFFALWPDEAIRSLIVERTASHLREAGGRRVPPANLHLTIAFLGSVSESCLTCLERTAAALRASAFDLRMERVEHWRHARLLCLEMAQPPAALLDLVAALGQVQRACGLAPEARPFRAHLTLARAARAARGLAPDIEPIVWPVHALCLMESVTAAEGARYERLQSWPLGNA
jgi:RNA 2',3'-cyclic 3'-phosphodiesterase